MTRHYQSLSALLTGLLISSLPVMAKNKHVKAKDASQDEIEVVAHLVLAGGPITQFLPTQHYRRDYLYASRADGKDVTLLDVTSADTPKIVANAATPVGGNADLVAGTGNALLVSEGPQGAQGNTVPQTFRIMSFADPAHPLVKHEFKDVTAVARNDKRGLIYLANPDGIWVLQQNYAQDPELEKAWEHMMLDAR